jgi:hypothetical protein
MASFSNTKTSVVITNGLEVKNIINNITNFELGNI